MRALKLLGVSLAFALSLGIAQRSAAPCEAVGEIQFICGVISPEDLAIVPGAEWVIASGNQEGGRIQLVSVRDKTTTVLFPTPARHERLDATTYPTCPGPLASEEKEAFRAHGLYLKPGQVAVHTLYVVHHGTRESVEVFEVDAQATPPALTWVGCAIAPEALGLNGVVALPEGGFAATSPRTGDVWEWQTGTGWTRIPGSEDTAPNGLEISQDGRWLYIAGWGEEKLTRLSRGQTPVQKDVVAVGFRPDNLRMSPDGSVIFAAGHGNIQDTARAVARDVERCDDRPADVGRPADFSTPVHRRIRGVHDGHSDWERHLAWNASWRDDRVFPGAGVELPRGWDGWAEYRAAPPGDDA